MTKYILPVSTAVLLLLFFLGLPEMDKVPADVLAPRIENCRNPRRYILNRWDILIMLAFVTVFTLVDFFRLGNTTGVQTFAAMGGKQAVITLENPVIPHRISLYTGVGSGEYSIAFSADGEHWNYGPGFNQEAGDVLRWNYIYPDTANLESVSLIRISATGNAWLGEFCLSTLDANGFEVPVILSSDVPELTDEQSEYCEEYSFLNSSYFDEIYHARTAWEHKNNVYPYEISHPPLGKLIISFGITLFGMTPFGWRFSGTLFGVLMLPLLYVLIRKLFGSRRVATAATLVFATDFMHFVQTRIATIDTYSVFFILLMYLFMYIFLRENRLWALALSGVAFGLGAASKWTCIYAGAGLAVLWAIYWIVNRREGFRAFLRNALFCLVFFVAVPCVIYYLSYIPYGTAQGVYRIFSREYLNIVLSNQEYMFSYHSSLVATHPYSSVWYQWILDIRPILYYLQYRDSLRSSFGAFVNPVLCWGGLLSMFVVIYGAALRKDRNALFILIGYLAQLVPWMFVTRLTFAYHYFPDCVFLSLAVAYVFHTMEEGRRPGVVSCKAYIWGFAGLSAVVFVLFFPALTGIWIDNALGSRLLQWLPTWPF